MERARYDPLLPLPSPVIRFNTQNKTFAEMLELARMTGRACFIEMPNGNCRVNDQKSMQNLFCHDDHSRGFSDVVASQLVIAKDLLHLHLLVR
jgi:hypothetical protein